MNFNVTIDGNVTISLTPDADGIQLDIWAEVPDDEAQGAEAPETPDQGTETSKGSGQRQDSLKMTGSGAGGTRLFNHSSKAVKDVPDNSEVAEAEAEATDNLAADSCNVKVHKIDDEFMKEMEEILQGMKRSREEAEDAELQKNSCAGLKEDEPDDEEDFPDDLEDDDYDDEDDGLLEDWDLDDFLEEKTLEELMDLWYGLRSVGITVESPGFFEEEDDCDKDKIVMVLTPGEEPKVVTYGEADMLMPDFCVDYDCIENFMGNKLNLYHREGDVIRLGGEKFLTGPAVLCFEGRDGSLWSLTGKEVYQVFRYYQVNKASLALKPHCPDAKRTKAIQLWK